ncbi:MAG TPA: nitrilase-related carbon-nitrogen hydrolase, partial [Methylovirgula sp.]
MDFRSIYSQGFARVAACTTMSRVADPSANAEAILALLAEVDAKAAALAVFPELALSGYAIDDLLLQDALHAAIAAAVERLVTASADLLPLILVGAPLRYEGRLYNCALAIHRGQLLGVIPKVHLPNYREFYERRHFASGHGMIGEIAIGDRRAPFGPDLLFVAEDVPGLVVHAEICEDLWVPVPQSSIAALAGATVLANLSASNITIGKSETRQLLIKSQSQRCLAAYLYSAAGKGESSTDLAWDGETTIAENGAILAESARFSD